MATIRSAMPWMMVTLGCPSEKKKQRFTAKDAEGSRRTQSRPHSRRKPGSTRPRSVLLVSGSRLSPGMRLDFSLCVLCNPSATSAVNRSFPLRHLEQAGGAHAAADAHRADDELGAPPLALDQCVPDHPRPRHAVGMADRDRAAIDVELVIGDAEPVSAIDHLAGERLVQFPQIDVVDRQPVLSQ